MKTNCLTRTAPGNPPPSAHVGFVCTLRRGSSVPTDSGLSEFKHGVEGDTENPPREVLALCESPDDFPDSSQVPTEGSPTSTVTGDSKIVGTCEP